MLESTGTTKALVGARTRLPVFALAVAVGLTPEMLPMIVSVCLSKGALLMSKKKVIVKRLNSIQNLGAMDVLCTDKHGHADDRSRDPWKSIATCSKTRARRCCAMRT